MGRHSPQVTLPGAEQAKGGGGAPRPGPWENGGGGCPGRAKLPVSPRGLSLASGGSLGSLAPGLCSLHRATSSESWEAVCPLRGMASLAGMWDPCSPASNQDPAQSLS